MIDFHCHLDLYPDPHGVAARCADHGLYVLSVTTTPSAWRGTASLADGAQRIRTALGMHPQLAHERAAHVLDACARAGGRIMSIHSRRAATAVLDLLEGHTGAGIPVLHWFSGNRRDLERAISLGCWFSVGPAMLRSGRGRELAELMPRDRILTESDGPFAQIDGAALMPWQVRDALLVLADLWRTSAADVENAIQDNLKALLKIAPDTRDPGPVTAQ